MSGACAIDRTCSAAAHSVTSGKRILVVRLGAMGDILHALPAAASLKHSFPGSRLTWAVEPRWAPLLEGNPFIDRVVLVRRGSPAGLSAELPRTAGGALRFRGGFSGARQIRAGGIRWRGPSASSASTSAGRAERAAALFYSNRVASPAAHVVDRNLDLAAGAGARERAARPFRCRRGSRSPRCRTDLSCWRARWPAGVPSSGPWSITRELAARLRREAGMTLVVDGPAAALNAFAVRRRTPSGTSPALPGLIHATRRAAAVSGRG